MSIEDIERRLAAVEARMAALGLDRPPASTERGTALGVLIRFRRRSMFTTMEAAAAAAGISRVTWGDAERGTKLPQRGTLDRIEQALSWAPGSAIAYLNGGPEPTDMVAPAEPDRDEADIRALLDHIIGQLNRLLADKEQS